MREGIVLNMDENSVKRSKKTVMVFLDASDYDKVVKLAEDNRLSLSSQLRSIVCKGL